MSIRIYQKKKKSSNSLRLKPQQLDVACFQLKEKEKNKQTNKPEYKKSHKNTKKTNIKIHHEYKRGALAK